MRQVKKFDFFFFLSNEKILRYIYDYYHANRGSVDFFLDLAETAWFSFKKNGYLLLHSNKVPTVYS